MKKIFGCFSAALSANRFLLILMALSLAACQKELSFENADANLTPATGSLKDTSGNCLSSTVHGTWYNGVKPGDTNYVDITVNVTWAGSYTISTDLQNGVSFADAGAFTGTGLNTVRLKPTGTFIDHKASSFTMSFDGSTCGFTINVQDSTGTGLGGSNSGGSGGSGGGTGGTVGLNAWTFTAKGHVYNGKVLSAQFTTLIGANITIAGLMQSNSTDTIFALSVQFPGSTLDPGTYPTSDAGTNFTLEKGAPSGDIIFAANAITSPPLLNIKITTYDKTAKTVEGTFSGDSYDFSGNTVPITNGAFKAKLQ